MYKSWMTKSRCTREYRDKCRSFVDFAVRNCRCPNGKIHRPYKKCQNNQCHSLDVVLCHLIGGKGIMPTYINWYYHNDKLVRLTALVPNLTATSTYVIRSTEPDENMHTILRDVLACMMPE
jgi:hypothetical protein